MSRSVFSIIYAILWIVIQLFTRGSRMLLTVLDIVDDGVRNGSVTTPEWFEKVRAIADYLESAIGTLKEFPATYNQDCNGDVQ